MSQTTYDSDLVRLDAVRIQLSRLWFIGVGLVFLILVTQTVLGKYSVDDVQKVWSWFVPTTFPTLALMIGVLGASANRGLGTRFCNKGFKVLTFWLSLTYLLILAATILLQPFSSIETVKLFQVSNYYLTPIQGLVVTAIGFIFTSNKQTEKDSKQSGEQEEAVVTED